MAGILLEGSDVSMQQRAEFAKSMAAEQRAHAIARLAALPQEEMRARADDAVRIQGTTIADTVIPEGRHWSMRLAKGDSLRIIDLEGRQAVDFLCFDARNTENRYNAANTIKLNRSIFLQAGSKLYGELGDPLMTIVGDTVGYHDTIGGCCSTEMNFLRYGVPNTPSCRNNFGAALRELGLTSRDLVANVNFFMFVPVAANGGTEIVEGKSQPYDYVELRAECDLMIAISNCPQIYNPCNGWNPTPIRLIHFRTPM